MPRKFCLPLLKYQAYLTFILATLLSGVGSGFIQALVYSQIALNKLPPVYFGMAFSLSVFPALLGSYAGKTIAASRNSGVYLALSQLLSTSVIYLIFTIGFQNNIKYILLSEGITSFTASIAFPSLQKLIKLTFKYEKLGLAAKLDTYLFGANVILGLGLGSVLISLITFKQLLLTSCVLYIFSSVFYLYTPSKSLITKDEASKEIIFLWGRLSSRQKMSFILMPTLIIIGTPATSLLPSIYYKFKGNHVSNYLMISPVLMLLIFRSIGQFVGPLLIKTKNYDSFSQNNKIIYFSLIVFITTYICIFTTHSFYLALTLIILAHTASNVVFTMAIYLTLASFETEIISQITAMQYRINQIVISLTAIFSGFIANHLGGRITIAIFAVFGLSVFTLLTPRNDKLSKTSYV